MPQLVIVLAMVALPLALAAPAAAFTMSIDGPGNVWVPYNRCVNATWNASSTSSIDTYDWTWDSQQVSTASSYSEYFCSPSLEHISTEYHTIALYATSGGFADYDSKEITVIYEAGEGDTGCGTQIICDP